MTNLELIRLVDLYIKWRREDIPEHLLPTYDKVAGALHDQYVLEYISTDLLIDTLDNVAYELTYIENSKWMERLMNSMGI